MNLIKELWVFFERAQEILAFPRDCGDAFLRCVNDAGAKGSAVAPFIYTIF